MAAQVVAACVPLPVAVVCDDQDVAQWASELGATVMWEPGQGLNGAVRAGSTAWPGPAPTGSPLPTVTSRERRGWACSHRSTG